MLDLEIYRHFLNHRAPLRAVPGVPEISLHHIDREHLRKSDPNFAIAVWPGGVWMARYILDNPEVFKDTVLLEYGCGTGFVAIAAAKVGAKVTAWDIDERAVAYTLINAEKNGVKVDARQIVDSNIPNLSKFDVVITTDTFYFPNCAEYLFQALNNGPYTLYIADGSWHRDLHELEGVQKYGLDKAQLISLQRRTAEEIANSMPTAVKIISPRPQVVMHNAPQ